MDVVRDFYVRTRRREIDQRTIKLLIGYIAIGIIILPALLAYPPILNSISESYWAGTWPQAIFIGFLFAIAAFMLAYNGFSVGEMQVSKLAAIAAFGVAMLPCECGRPNREIVPFVHYISAGVLFLALIYFCLQFRRRALRKRKHVEEARNRAKVYVACAAAIVLAIVPLLADNLLKRPNPSGVGFFGFTWFTFFGESLGLFAFGVSWLVASRSLPISLVTHPDERFSPLRDINPPDEEHHEPA